MINSATDADSFIKDVQAISAFDPFACRIISLCNSYKPDLVFVDYWLVQDDNGNNTGAIARNGSNFILLLTDGSDIDEISSFLRVAGASAVICDGKYELDFTGGKMLAGKVLVRDSAFDDLEPLSFIDFIDIF